MSFYCLIEYGNDIHFLIARTPFPSMVTVNHAPKFVVVRHKCDMGKAASIEVDQGSPVKDNFHPRARFRSMSDRSP